MTDGDHDRIDDAPRRDRIPGLHKTYADSGLAAADRTPHEGPILDIPVGAKPPPLRLRAGTKVGRTLYRVNPDGTEDLIGIVDTVELAAAIVDAVNARADAAG